MHGLNTVIVALMTTKNKSYPTRIPIKFAGKKGYIVLNQIQTVDKLRLVEHLGTIDKKSATHTLNILREMVEW